MGFTFNCLGKDTSQAVHRQGSCAKPTFFQKMKDLGQAHKADEGQNQNWNSVFQLQLPRPHSSSPSQDLNLEFSLWNGRIVWLLFNLLTSFTSFCETRQERNSMFEPFFAIWQYFNFKQMVGGRGVPQTGWGYAPSAFARGLETLKPEFWHRTLFLSPFSPFKYWERIYLSERWQEHFILWTYSF